uniref:Putative secreted protein n=1 Tax=Ixodes ricinus TaxID=34613 RepID=A0A6B0UJP8_IXORI
MALMSVCSVCTTPSWHLLAAAARLHNSVCTTTPTLLRRWRVAAEGVGEESPWGTPWLQSLAASCPTCPVAVPWLLALRPLPPAAACATSPGDGTRSWDVPRCRTCPLRRAR